MSLTAGLSATKTGLDLARGIYDLLGRNEIQVSEIQSRLLELQALILQAQQTIGESEEENRKLKRQVESMQEVANISSQLEFAQNLYLRRNAKGDLDGPFCSVCWDHNQKLVRLISKGERQWPDHEGPMIRYDCIVHGIEVFLSPQVFKYKTLG